MEEMESRNKFNISLLGDTTVGKTSIANVKYGKSFSEQTLLTVGIEFTTETVLLNNKNITFKVFDTAGQERYKSISKSTIHYSSGFMLIFAVNKRETFAVIESWLDIIKDEIDTNSIVIYLVGNKVDINKREVTNEEAVNYANKNNMKYFETSAKTGYGIEEVFTQMYKDIYYKYLADLKRYKSKSKDVAEKKQSVQLKKKNHKESKNTNKSGCC